ncbi:MAG: hypothetical protein P8M68_01505 [Aquiluna sp.]|nr:hypothetical protein [Aquiluna sp.]
MTKFIWRPKSKALARQNTNQATLNDWSGLVNALVERSKLLDPVDVFTVQFLESKFSSPFGDNLSLMIGRTQGLFHENDSDVEYFLHAVGAPLESEGKTQAELSWDSIGFSKFDSKGKVSFAVGPLGLNDLVSNLHAALSVFELFYGVGPLTIIQAVGDPKLERMLAEFLPC